MNSAASADRFLYSRMIGAIYLLVFGTIGWIYSPNLLLTLVVSMLFGIVVHGGAHMYFSHRAFELNRVNQFILALLVILVGQESPLIWASFHRRHHRFADTDQDHHSPMHMSFFSSFLGWTFRSRNIELSDTDIQDLKQFPELVWITKYHGYIGFVILCTFTLVQIIYFEIKAELPFWYEFFLASKNICIWLIAPALHSFIIAGLVNVVAHRWGSRSFEISDNSRNNVFVGIYGVGSGWHNNHHAHPQYINCGHHWWQIDITYYAVWLFHKLGVVKSMRIFRAD